MPKADTEQESPGAHLESRSASVSVGVSPATASVSTGNASGCWPGAEGEKTEEKVPQPGLHTRSHCPKANPWGFRSGGGNITNTAFPKRNKQERERHLAVQTFQGHVSLCELPVPPRAGG